MYRGNAYHEALKLKYLAEIAEAEAVLGTYFKNSVGIGEHSELLPEFDKWIGKLAEAKLPYRVDNAKELARELKSESTFITNLR